MTRKEYILTVEQHADSLHRYAVKLLGNQTEAEDIVQQAFMKLWEKRDDVDFERVKYYLLRSVYNLVVDLSRKTKNKQLYIAHNNINKSQRADGFEDRQWIEKAFEQLPAKYKQLILLRDYEGFSYEDICEQCNMTMPALKTNLFRARKQLRTILLDLKGEAKILKTIG